MGQHVSTELTRDLPELQTNVWCQPARLQGRLGWLAFVVAWATFPAPPCGQDSELSFVCLVGLLWRFTLKAALKWTIKMLLISAVLWSRTGLGVQLGTGVDCSVACTTWLRHFLWQGIWIIPKSSCQQTGLILQSQHGNQKWIAR